MTSWTELRASALVGVARRPLAEATVAGVGIDRAAPEDRALVAAALLGVQRRAGVRPDRTTRIVAAAPDDPRPPASRHAAQLLELVLGGATGRADADALLAHWFRSCAAAGQRIPDHLAVDVLTVATTRASLRDAAHAALGATARWMAGLRGDWSWAASDDDLTTNVHGDGGDGAEPLHVAWATATTDERLRLLRRARRLDPSLPRRLLESTWSVDSAADREAALTELAAAADHSDEPLFEAALDDRSKKVRAVALHVLDAFPWSARAARMAERLRPLVRQRGLLRGSLAVELPDDPDAAAVRDGLGDPPTKSSRRAWWLERLVIGAPLDLWTDVTGKSPEQIVRMGVEPAAVLDHWVAAAARQGDVAWAEALFERTTRTELLAVLPRPRAEAMVERAVRAGAAPDTALRVARDFDGRWSASLSDAVLQSFRKAANSSDAAAAAKVAYLVPELAPHLDPAVTPALEAWRASAGDTPLGRQLAHILTHVSTFEAIRATFVASTGRA